MAENDGAPGGKWKERARQMKWGCFLKEWADGSWSFIVFQSSVYNWSWHQNNMHVWRLSQLISKNISRVCGKLVQLPCQPEMSETILMYITLNECRNVQTWSILHFIALKQFSKKYLLNDIIPQSVCVWFGTFIVF